MPIFQKKANILKLFLCTHRMYFWKSRQKLLDQNQEIFRPMSESDKIFFLPNFFSTQIVALFT